jgi:two-component system osmolarity sensor histidine kinase EnvZ
VTLLSDSTNIAAKPPQADPEQGFYWRFNRFLERHFPQGLYRRSLIIVIAPMVLLQSIMAFIFMERHWDRVTKALSRSVARDIAFVVDVYENSPRTPEAINWLETVANEKLALGLDIEVDSRLPPPAPKPFFSLLDKKLSKYIVRYTGKPFWIDTLGKSGFVDVRVQADDGVIFRFLTNQDRASASNTHIFLLWMVGSALVLLFVAILFLRKQISPIVQLAEAAQSFGMGREVEEFEPRGASEVRDAAYAFIDMKRRIERHVEQRTAMLAGVSHDLRTILTRFKLELAVAGDLPQTKLLKQDVDEMERMLEGYIAFVRGDGGEVTRSTDICEVLTGITGNMKRTGVAIQLKCPKSLSAPVKPDAFKRCIANLVSNAARFADQVELAALNQGNYLIVTVDDNGPGIAANKRDDVFRPFVRLDNSRNQDQISTGLGLAIAKDIAQSHGGDITLSDSHLGGLRARVHIPV